MSTKSSGEAAGAGLLAVTHDGAVTHLRLTRPAKRNALNDDLVKLLHATFVNLPQATRVVVLSGEGEHFCAGLDLSEVSETSDPERRPLTDSGRSAASTVLWPEVLVPECTRRLNREPLTGSPAALTPGAPASRRNSRSGSHRSRAAARSPTVTVASTVAARSTAGRPLRASENFSLIAGPRPGPGLTRDPGPGSLPP